MTNQPTNQTNRTYTVEVYQQDTFYSVNVHLMRDDRQFCHFSFQTDADRTDFSYYGLQLHMSETDSISDLQDWTKEVVRITKRMPQGFSWDADVLDLLHAIDASGYKQVVFDRRINKHISIEEVQPSNASLYFPVINGWNARVFQCLNESRVEATRMIVSSMDSYNLDQWIESGMTVQSIGPDGLHNKPDDRTARYIVVDCNPFNPEFTQS